jgi:hypothetical protein
MEVGEVVIQVEVSQEEVVEEATVRSALMVVLEVAHLEVRQEHLVELRLSEAEEEAMTRQQTVPLEVRLCSMVVEVVEVQTAMVLATEE